MNRLWLALFLSCGSCVHIVETTRPTPVSVVSNPAGATVWIEQNGQREKLGATPLLIEVPYEVRTRRFQTWSLLVPLLGALALPAGYGIGELGGRSDDTAIIGAVVFVSGLLAAAAGLPAVLIGLAQDGRVVYDEVARGVRVGTSHPGYHDEVQEVRTEMLARGHVLYFRPVPLEPGEAKDVPAVLRRVGDQKDLPENLRPDRYQPTRGSSSQK